jgi:hypothetical protein
MRPYYEHAGIAIYHGDCQEILAAGGIRADLLCTDPPYASPPWALSWKSGTVRPPRSGWIRRRLL